MLYLVSIYQVVEKAKEILLLMDSNKNKTFNQSSLICILIKIIENLLYGEGAWEPLPHYYLTIWWPKS